MGLFNPSRRNTPGFGLIEVLVATVILTVITLAIVSVMNWQSTELRAFSEKLSSQALELQMRNVLSSVNYCECLLRGSTLDTTTSVPTWSSFPNSMPGGYNQPVPLPPAPCPPRGDAIVPEVGQRIAGTNLRVLSFAMENIQPLSSGTYKGEFVVGYDSSNLVRSFKGPRASIVFSVNPSAGSQGARPFVSCAPLSGLFKVLTPGESFVVPAKSCPNAIALNAWMRARNGDHWFNTQWVRFPISDNGNPLFDLTLQGGKTGDHGHGWYFLHDISRTYYITTIAQDHNITAEPVILGGGVISPADTPQVAISCL